ncbi:hypothetical protein EMCRGX_G011379 [Ephydatia muelleri]
MPLSGLVEVALFSNLTACFSSSGSVQFTKTSDSRRSITPGARLTWEETKGPSSEQQGQFTAPDAAIHSWRHLNIPVHHTAVPVAVRGCWSTVHTSAPLTSTGCSCLPKVD